MPLKKGAGGGGKKARSPSEVQSGRAFAAQQRKMVGAAAHDITPAKLAALSKLLERKEKAAGVGSPEAQRLRLQLADACSSAQQYDKACKLLQAMAPSRCPGARRLLCPVLLRLGKHSEAASLLVAWPNDDSTAMAFCALLLSLASWTAGDAKKASAQHGSEEACLAAFTRAYSANWYLALLLCAWRTAATIPESFVAEARSPHAAVAAAPSMGPVAAAAAGTTDTTAPPAGGIEEALSLSFRDFGGWAGPEIESDDEELWRRRRRRDTAPFRA